MLSMAPLIHSLARLALRQEKKDNTLATTASADFSNHISMSGFHPQNEISPGKNALLHCTTAGFTSLIFDHKSFAEIGPLALISTAFYPIFVHRPAASIHASFPTICRLLAVALPFTHCGQLVRGLSPPDVCPCRAHTKTPAFAGV